MDRWRRRNARLRFTVGEIFSVCISVVVRLVNGGVDFVQEFALVCRDWISYFVGKDPLISPLRMSLVCVSVTATTTASAREEVRVSEFWKLLCELGSSV